MSNKRLLAIFLVLVAVISTTFITYPRAPETTSVEAALYLENAPTLNIVVSASSAQAALQAVESLGGQAMGPAGEDGELAATLPASQLDALAIYPGIRTIRTNPMIATAAER
jgi:hypothetical protein